MYHHLPAWSSCLVVMAGACHQQLSLACPTLLPTPRYSFCDFCCEGEICYSPFCPYLPPGLFCPLLLNVIQLWLDVSCLAMPFFQRRSFFFSHAVGGLNFYLPYYYLVPQARHVSSSSMSVSLSNEKGCLIIRFPSTLTMAWHAHAPVLTF